MSNSLPPFLDSCALLPGQPSTDPCLYSNALFRHKCIPSLSHALWWPGNPDCTTCLVFFPGNPGLLDFYTPFLTAVHEKTEQRLSILAHGFVGHTPGIDDSDTDPSKVCLSAQVEAAIEVTDAVKSAFTKVVVAGHSVGSWVATQVLKARAHEVDSLMLLFPTIRHIVNTPKGRRLSWLFQAPYPSLISWLSIATRLIPTPLLKLLFPDWPSAQLMVLRMLLNSPGCIRACLTMAHDEMSSIGELDVELLLQNRHKIHMYFAEFDEWIGDNKAAILGEFSPDEGNLKIIDGRDDIPHAFCINHGEELAEQCHKWLKEGQLL